DGLSEWLAMVAVIALEVGSALAGLLVVSVGDGHHSGQLSARDSSNKPDTTTDDHAVCLDTAAPDTKTRANAGEPVPAPRQKRTARKAKKRTRHKGGKGGPSGRRLGNVVDLLKARGGQIKGGQRGIAKQLKLSKSRVNEVLHQLAEAGTV